MIRLVTALLLLFMLPLGSEAATAAPVRVRLETAAGPIVIELEMKRAPVTAANFLRYAEEKRFDGTFFYRAARRRNNPKTGLVQGGINHRVVRARVPIAHEPTSRTGLKHVDGTVSMARNAPGTAMGDFFITVGPAAYLDARPGSAGYAAFGRVVQGMELVRRMLAAPTYPGGRSENTKGQQIISPIRIISARRVR
jgi:peptidyl-prolyl cis-trans isomerase A (cyclophilin A)